MFFLKKPSLVFVSSLNYCEVLYSTEHSEGHCSLFRINIYVRSRNESRSENSHFYKENIIGENAPTVSKLKIKSLKYGNF